MAALFYRPDLSLRCIRRGNLGAAWLTAGLAGLALQIALVPYVLGAVPVLVDPLPGMTSSESIVRTVLLVSALLHPVFLLGRCAMTGLLLFLAGRCLGGSIRFRQAWSLAAHGAVYQVFETAQVLAILSLRGVASVETAADLQPPLGLDLLVTGSGIGAAVARQLHLPGLAVAGLWIAGMIHLNPEVRPVRCALLAAAVWLTLALTRAWSTPL